MSVMDHSRYWIPESPGVLCNVFLAMRSFGPITDSIIATTLIFIFHIFSSSSLRSAQIFPRFLFSSFLIFPSFGMVYGISKINIKPIKSISTISKTMIFILLPQIWFHRILASLPTTFWRISYLALERSKLYI